MGSGKGKGRGARIGEVASTKQAGQNSAAVLLNSLIKSLVRPWLVQWVVRLVLGPNGCDVIMFYSPPPLGDGHE